MEYPNSPYFLAKNLVEDFKSGKRTLEEYVEALDVFENFLQQWSDSVSALPEVPNFEQGLEIKNATLESLDLYFDAVVLFRHFGETGQEESAKQGMQLAREGHALMLHLQQQAFKEASRIEDEMG